MPTEFKLPELGENVEKGDVVRVIVAVGDTIAVDQAVLELETDKATIEVPSSVAGKVSAINVKVGDKVKVGQVVLVVDAAAAASEPAKKTAEQKPAEQKPAEPTEQTSTDDAQKAATAATTSEAGESAPPPPPPAKPSADVVDINSGRSVAPPAPVAAAQAPRREGVGLELAAPVPAAPSVRRFARELGVEIGGVPGSGPGGRIGPEDVKQHVRGLVSGGSSGVTPAAPLPDFSKWGSVEAKPMSNIRRKTAEHLSASWRAPHVTQHDKADVTAFEEFRRTYGSRVERGGGKLTVTAALVKIVAAAVQKFPQFASSIDVANDSVIYKKYCNIGIAVDTPNGLLVPVIRDVDRKTITEIAADLAAVSQKARDKKLGLDDMAGGVFTISNLGGIGGTSFTPIVNMPEVAILGVSRASKEPVWKDGPANGLGAGQFVPRDMLPLSLSYDHRVIDGADGARFLRFIVEALEQPMTMVL